MSISRTAEVENGNKTMVRALMGVLAGVLLAGCAGEMTGVVRGSGTPVKIAYEQGMDHDVYVMQLAGETYRGKAVPANSQSGYGWTSTGDAIFGSTTSGAFVATLLGNKGSSMRCQMNYADSSGFTTAGGVGLCKTSKGQTIDIVW
ncbi:hypothetical protein [Shimia biformata]|uniref:hypothetical protein n=1 Tax=Shimia biformata TaxID=1294299 RepID=UPI00194FAE54|nr:hypothetical protein [Shimia biformata]